MCVSIFLAFFVDFFFLEFVVALYKKGGTCASPLQCSLHNFYETPSLIDLSLFSLSLSLLLAPGMDLFVAVFASALLSSVFFYFHYCFLSL